MVKHPSRVEGYDGTLEELAKAIGNMDYNQTSLFLEKLADDIKKQADADYARGRKKLASHLYATANKLYEAREKMDVAIRICKPYMKD